MKRLLLAFLILISFISFSQPYFQRYDDYQVKINANILQYPWAGGLNFIQASNIDLNLDGINDLFIFDRSGNKVKTFINNGTIGTVDYRYAPQYENDFPALEEWVLLADYNCDGKSDIFTYASYNGKSGIKVYKNTSSVATGVQFILVNNLLASTTELYVSSIDIPAISDIDNDGDLDVVTFEKGGVYLEYHVNKSKELYGTCDSLLFEIKNHCWGYAAENYMSNFYSLNDTCVINVANPEMATDTSTAQENEKRHSGSCELCIDLNGDGDKDFIAGDISYKNLTMLTNGGTPTANHFSAIDAVFPLNNGGSQAVDLTIFPCAFYVDVNTDGKNDLIVSPNAPSSSENFKSLVYYKNIGTSNFPVFQYQQSDVLQDNMIDVGEGSYPAIVDYDNDGLKDLFIGNYGYYAYPTHTSKIAYFKNNGTLSVPKYELVTRDFDNLSSFNILNMIPAFGDLDGDLDDDMIIGASDGRLHYFENTASLGFPAYFVLTQVNFKNSNNRIIDVGDDAAPCIADIDGDGKNDLIIGSRNGKLAYYHKVNDSGFPQLDSVSHFWGGVNVTLPSFSQGNSFPYVFKNAGKTELLIGSKSGYLYRYDHIDGNLTGIFNLIDPQFMNIREGATSAPTGADINNDGYWELFIGNYSGGISFYKGMLTGLPKIENKITWNFEMYPNPANKLITIQITNTNSKLFKVELYNTLGQLILSKQISDKLVTINTEELNQGIYICKVSCVNSNGSIDHETIVKRMLIRH